MFQPSVLNKGLFEHINKDFVRAEKEVFLLFEQFVQGISSGTRNGSEDADTGKSLPLLPLFRGWLARSQEQAHRKLECALDVGQFVDLLPSVKEGYDEGYLAAMELVLPLNKLFEPISFEEEWSEARHNLRRESLGQTRANPFNEYHEKTPSELKAMLPEKVRDFIKWHPALREELDVRVQFTKAVVLWNDWYEFSSARDEKIKAASDLYEQDVKKKHREWFTKMKDMDHVASFW